MLRVDQDMQVFNQNFTCSGFNDNIETIDLSSENSSGNQIFKKHHLDILDRILEEFDLVEPKLTAKQVLGARRRSRQAPEKEPARTSRQAKLQEKLSPTYQLKQAIVKRRLTKRSETAEDAMVRFLPDVCLTKLTKEQAQRLSRPWGFLDRIEIKDKYKFTANIIKKRESPEPGENEWLVEWSPPGILENGWLKTSELPKDGVKIVNVTNFSWRQKLLLGGHLEKATQNSTEPAT